MPTPSPESILSTQRQTGRSVERGGGGVTLLSSQSIILKHTCPLWLAPLLRPQPSSSLPLAARLPRQPFQFPGKQDAWSSSLSLSLALAPSPMRHSRRPQWFSSAPLPAPPPQHMHKLCAPGTRLTHRIRLAMQRGRPKTSGRIRPTALPRGSFRALTARNQTGGVFYGQECIAFVELLGASQRWDKSKRSCSGFASMRPSRPSETWHGAHAPTQHCVSGRWIQKRK